MGDIIRFITQASSIRISILATILYTDGYLKILDFVYTYLIEPYELWGFQETVYKL
jgi:hypothetical protein